MTSTGATAAPDPAGIARAFHEDVPAQNRDLMTATVGRLLADGVIAFPLDRDALAALAADLGNQAAGLGTWADQAEADGHAAEASNARNRAVGFAESARLLLAAIGEPS